jgi:serine/threonine-protein kinase PpkA
MTLAVPRSAALDGRQAHVAREVPQIPGYRLLRVIGRGRRSTAWLALDLRDGADVVLKIAAAGALEREAEVAARVQGPNLVRVYAQGRAGHRSWLAMEHIAGSDLATRMRGGLARPQALALLAQAAEGLAQLHRQRLVHRDVKPANLLLRGDGRLVLADYGLVAATGAANSAGALFGTPRYVAPEQLQGAPAAPAADVYSLGVVLYEMLCGRPPFPGETLMEILSQHLLAQPARLPDPLADLQPLVDRMLAKEVQCRLPDADAVLGLIGRRC